MSEWTITVTYQDVDDATRDAWEDRLAQFDAFSASVPGVESTLALHAAGPDLAGVLGGTLQAAFAATNLEPVAVDAASPEVVERRAAAPTMPRLVSAPEVGEMLGGISRQRVYQLQERRDFPEPLFRLRTGPVWDELAVEAFARGWKRQPGRPAKPGRKLAPVTARKVAVRTLAPRKAPAKVTKSAPGQIAAKRATR